jgi:DNA-binding MarR family transcriptional regulator
MQRPPGSIACHLLGNRPQPAKHGSGTMSFAATLCAWKREDISATQKLVLLDLCDRANAANQCWPKQRTIASRVRLTERAVCTALAALQQKGLIRRLPRIKFGKRTSDLITVLVASDKPEAKAIESKTPPKPLSSAAASKSPATEAASGDRRNVVQPDTGTTFSVISHTEPLRSNLTSVSSLLELMPQSGRPDIDEHNAAVWFLEGLRSKIKGDIDWSDLGPAFCAQAARRVSARFRRWHRHGHSCGSRAECASGRRFVVR